MDWYLVDLSFFGTGAFETIDLVDQRVPDELHFRKRNISREIGLQDSPHKGSVFDVAQCGKIDIW